MNTYLEERIRISNSQRAPRLDDDAVEETTGGLNSNSQNKYFGGASSLFLPFCLRETRTIDHIPTPCKPSFPNHCDANASFLPFLRPQGTLHSVLLDPRPPRCFQTNREFSHTHTRVSKGRFGHWTSIPSRGYPAMQGSSRVDSHLPCNHPCALRLKVFQVHPTSRHAGGYDYGSQETNPTNNQMKNPQRQRWIKQKRKKTKNNRIPFVVLFAALCCDFLRLFVMPPYVEAATSGGCLRRSWRWIAPWHHGTMSQPSTPKQGDNSS